MHALRPVFASALLIALAMGGVVLPALHDAAHALERTEVELAHSDHHHHQLEDAHGTEAQPYCPDAADVDLVCAFCSAPPIASAASSSAGFNVSESPLRSEAAARWVTTDETPRAARGPPAA